MSVVFGKDVVQEPLVKHDAPVDALSDRSPDAILPGHFCEVDGALALADGRFPSWSDDNTLRLWNQTDTPVAVFYADARLICCVVSPQSS